VTDVQFAHAVQRRHRRHVERGESVPGVERKPRGTHGRRGSLEFRELGRGLRSAHASPVILERVRPGPRVQLADGRPRRPGRLHLSLLRVDEHAHRNAAIGEPSHDVGDPRLPGRDIESPFRRHLLPSLRHEHGGVGHHASRELDHLVGRRHLQIETTAHRLAQAAHVVVLDVPPIFAKMHRDSVGAAELRLDRGRDRVRLQGAPRLPDRRHVIDVDAEFRHPTRVAATIAAVTDFDARLAGLERDLAAQGERVLDLCTRTVESYFDLDQEKARAVIAADDEVDRIDVELERRSVPLLGLGVTDEHRIREVLTIVKVNNELERIADSAVVVAEHVLEQGSLPERIPPTFRVMANSVLGVLRDSVRAMARKDAALARQVLLFDDTIERFKREILLHAQEQVALGHFSVHFAFRLMAVVKALERIADHCTNICEQVIYLRSGFIVRHRPEGWSEPAAPDA